SPSIRPRATRGTAWARPMRPPATRRRRSRRTRSRWRWIPPTTMRSRRSPSSSHRRRRKERSSSAAFVRDSGRSVVASAPPVRRRPSSRPRSGSDARAPRSAFVSHWPPEPPSMSPVSAIRRSSPLIVVLALLAPVASLAAKPKAPKADPEGAPPTATVLAAGDTASAPLDLGFGQPVVEVFVNGHGPYRMFLDTGAGTTVLALSLVEALGRAKRGKTRLGDPANPQAVEADKVLLDSLRIGAATFRGVSGVTFDRTSLHGDTNVPRGVVGFPVFHELLQT